MKKWTLILIICLLGLVLRFWQLGQIPNSLSGDEVASGYNAYSILKTGRDEYGAKFPLLFQSFNDHKNPVFVYTLVPFIHFFGLNALSIRLPSAIFGTLTLPLFYLLTKQLTKNKKLSLLTLFFAATSPWLIQYSRIAFETEAALFFSLLGVWAFLEARRKNGLYLLWAFSFSLAFWTYYSAKLWVILFGVILVSAEILTRRKLNKFLALGIILFLATTIPYLKLLSSGQVLSRQYGISVFSDAQERLTDTKLLQNDWQKGNKFGVIFHNRRFSFINQFSSGYLNILNPIYLFGIGGRLGGSQMPNTRLLYLWQLPLIIFGLIWLTKSKWLFCLICLWLFTGFIPGAITVLPVFDRRILINSYPLLLLTSLGIYKIIDDLKTNPTTKKVAVSIFIFLIAASFLFYQHNYFYHGEKAVVDRWGNGMENLVQQTNIQSAKGYNNVVVSLSIDRALWYFLFFDKYPPEKYLAQGGTISGDFREENNHFDNFQFKYIKKEELASGNLYVWQYGEDIKGLTAIKTIYHTDGTPFAYLGIYTPQPK